jgi:hypothetical protein
VGLVTIGRIAPGDARDAATVNAKFEALESATIGADNLQESGLDRASFGSMGGTIVGPLVETGSTTGAFSISDFATINGTVMSLPTFVLTTNQVARVRAKVSFITTPNSNWASAPTYGVGAGNSVQVKLKVTGLSGSILDGSSATIGNFRSIKADATQTAIPGHGTVVVEGWLTTPLSANEVGIAIDSSSNTVTAGRAIIWAHIFERVT